MTSAAGERPGLGPVEALRRIEAVHEVLCRLAEAEEVADA